MTAGDARQVLTQAEIDALAQKVEDWSRGLTSKERVFMADVIVRAANSDPADVEGYGAGALVQFPTLTGQASPGGQPVLPAESISLNFTKITMTYQEQK